ncbi:MAG: zf-HC2 domain-containing protein [bacterium]|nr:zf-HC2 domain-containing protein [bacterium]
MTMDCAQTDRLQDLLDGDLDAAAAAALKRHLGGCPACAAALTEMQRLRRAAAALPRGIAPGHDLWPGISARLDDGADARPGAARPRFDPASLRRPRRALALAAVLALAIVTPRLMDRAGGAADPGEELGDGYALLRDASKSAMKQTSEDLSPADRDDLKDGFSAIDDAIGETRRALRQARRDPSQTPGLAAGYHRKLDLLQRLVSRAAQS